jgi:UDP-N-acetylglucosamine acyltransferase
MPVDPSASIAPTARIHPNARIGPRTVVRDYCVIEDDVVIGADCLLEPYVFVKRWTTLGRRQPDIGWNSAGNRSARQEFHW